MHSWEQMQQAEADGPERCRPVPIGASPVVMNFGDSFPNIYQGGTFDVHVFKLDSLAPWAQRRVMRAMSSSRSSGDSLPRCK